jgi:hypothetical protein
MSIHVHEQFAEGLGRNEVFPGEARSVVDRQGPCADSGPLKKRLGSPDAPPGDPAPAVGAKDLLGVKVVTLLVSHLYDLGQRRGDLHKNRLPLVGRRVQRVEVYKRKIRLDACRL